MGTEMKPLDLLVRQGLKAIKNLGKAKIGFWPK